MKKIFNVMLFTLISIFNVNAQESASLKAVQFPQSANFTALSDNGEWASAKGVGEEDSSKDAYPFLVNIETGVLTSLWENETDCLGAWDVTNDGKTVVGNKNELPAICNTETREWTLLPTDMTLVSGTALNVTPDGKYISGFGSTKEFNTENYEEVPLLWEKQTDGTYSFVNVQDFNNFPHVDKSGKECNIMRIVMISSDGNLIGGVMNFIYPSEQTTFIYNKTTHQYTIIDNLLPNSESFIDSPAMSNNGKYVTGIAYIINGSEEYSSSCLYDIENNELTVYNETTDEKDRSGSQVSNSGIVFAASPAVSPTRSLYYRVGNFWYGIDELLAYKYNTDFYESLNYDYTGYAVGISDDEKTMIAMSGSKTYGYILKLPETFQNAAKSINLLKTYTISPVSGSVFAKFKEAVLTFAKATVMKSGAQAQLCDESGNVVKTYNITANSETKYIIGGIAYTLSDGKKYTLKIPEGTFSLKGEPTTTNEEITTTYTGRTDKPVSVLNVTPSQNTNVSELSSTNPIQFNFDIKIKLDDNAYALLYQESSETPIATLAAISEGSAVAFYPPVKRYLTKGVNYRVEVPAGIITDIMGYCGNEAITVNYTGAYEQQINITEGTIFSDNFNDVSNSMVRYLLYEGDHNVPTTEMQNLGFDKDNTPWNFTIRESEESDDYCVASTSSYNPAGKSDDWMSIPQLFIENDDYYLEFDAQSYRKSKNDVLKIYALVEDATYDYFSEDLYNKFKENGKVIFDETITPGDSEDNLTDNWINYSIRLDEFSGKNVYIAFVNENQDQSIIFIDNLKVAYHGDYLIGVLSPSTVVDQKSTEIKAFIKVTGDKTYNNLSVTCTNADGTFSDTYEASGLSLDKNSENYIFTFKNELPLEIGKQNNFKISAYLDGIQYSIQSSISDLAFEPLKRVLIEEGTGSWCGNCPLGILAFEHMNKIYGEQVIPIAIHNGDQMAYTEYENFLGFSSFPSGFVNRIDTLYAPAISTNVDGSLEYSFTSNEGNQTFEDIVIRELQEPTYSDLNISHAIYDNNKGIIEIKTSLKYAMDMSSINQNLSFIVIENGVSGVQNNYFYNNEDPFFGEWGKNQEHGQSLTKVEYNEVARKVLGSFSGIAGSVPGNATANSEINYMIQQTIPGTVSNWENAEVVAILIDANTGKVVNAAKKEFVSGTSGINEYSDNTNNLRIYSVLSNIIIEFNKDSEASVSIFDLKGSMIKSVNTKATAGENLEIGLENVKGIYIVKVVTPEQTEIRKVILN